jgi:hypothetical protein
MAEPTEAQLRELWRVGVPASQAWVTYALPQKKAYWVSLPKPFALQALVEGVTEGLGAGLPLAETLQKCHESSRPLVDAKDDMQATILRYIKEGQLFGFGYEPPRKLASPPVLIPKGMWLGKVDWDKSTVSRVGLHFIQVRLTTRHYWNEICGPDNNPLPPSVPVKGRPSVGPYIQKAAQALLKQGKINPEHSAKSHFPAIRNWLAQHSQDMPVPPLSINDETIRQHFANTFNALKKTNKQ